MGGVDLTGIYRRCSIKHSLMLYAELDFLEVGVVIK